jgi:hypothetical protein
MHENVRRAIIGLNETKTLGSIEPLYSTCAHNDDLSIAHIIVPIQGITGWQYTDFERKLVSIARNASQQSSFTNIDAGAYIRYAYSSQAETPKISKQPDISSKTGPDGGKSRHNF